ncbi:uncharacterized protein LOC112050547 [Bicyclus anynana]|uniref:Uncharacterized protein LOC112050547 n=1 Tax=Bicyclus anynana TaxID=110368 RepID=A0ABM3LYQ6_BICAN|nr:uncharacterized protein LOC112050547 [Bicyclus anynana]
MFALLLLLTQVSGDWVEISQNHYRKDPVHPAHFDYTTKSNSIYKNNSITEKQWHRGVVDKVSKGNIRPVQHPSVKASSVKIRHGDDRFIKYSNDYKTTEADYSFVSAKPNIQKFKTYDEDFEQTKHPYSKPIKKLETLPTNLNRRKYFDEKYSEDENDVINQEKQVQISEPPLAIPKKNMDEINFSENDNFFTRATPKLGASTSNSRHSNFVNNKDLSNPKIKLSNMEDDRHVVENDIKRVLQSDAENSDEIESYVKNLQPLRELNSSNTFRNIGLGKKHITKTAGEIEEPVQNNDKEGSSSIDEVTTNYKAEDHIPKSISNVTNSKTMKGMWKLLKLVTDTIYKNTHRSFKGKIKYLENLKTTILKSIEEQIDRAWPDDHVDVQNSRRSRAAQARGHVEFPSSESTLMTISFLTFAVFVIKLVLQVIHTYKNKTMMVTPAVVAAVGRAAAAFKTSQ